MSGPFVYNERLSIYVDLKGQSLCETRAKVHAMSNVSLRWWMGVLRP